MHKVVLDIGVGQLSELMKLSVSSISRSWRYKN